MHLEAAEALEESELSAVAVTVLPLFTIVLFARFERKRKSADVTLRCIH